MNAVEFFHNGNGVVTLLGSTKFFTECMEINRQLTFKGWIVLSCGSWGHSYHKDREGNTGADYEKVKMLHFKKILLSQAVVVVSDKSGYMGDSTKAEITFAKYLKMPTFYFDGVNLIGDTEMGPPNELNRLDKTIEEYVAKGNDLGFEALPNIIADYVTEGTRVVVKRTKR